MPRADNYNEEVADDFAFEEQNDNYMMYRNNSGEVKNLHLSFKPSRWMLRPESRSCEGVGDEGRRRQRLQRGASSPGASGRPRLAWSCGPGASRSCCASGCV